MKKSIFLLSTLCCLAGCTSPNALNSEAEQALKAHNAEVERVAAKADWAQKNIGRVTGFTSSYELYEHMSKVKTLVSTDSAVETKFCDVDYQFTHAVLQHERYGGNHRKYLKAELEWKQCQKLQSDIGKYYPANGEYLSKAYGFTLVDGCDMDDDMQDKNARPEWKKGGICSDALIKAKAQIREIRATELKALENLPPLKNTSGT